MSSISIGTSVKGSGSASQQAWIYYYKNGLSELYRRHADDTAGTTEEQVSNDSNIPTGGRGRFAVDPAAGLACINDRAGGVLWEMDLSDGSMTSIATGITNPNVTEDPGNSRWLYNNDDNIFSIPYGGGTATQRMSDSIGGGTWHQIKLDATNGYLMLVHETSGAVKRATVNGLAFDSLTTIETLTSGAYGVSVDPSQGWAFYYDQSGEGLRRVDHLTPGTPSEIVDHSAQAAHVASGVEVDTQDQKVYYLPSFGSLVRRCDYDGSNDESLWDMNSSYPFRLVLI